jgi:hypothetical protein
VDKKTYAAAARSRDQGGSIVRLGGTFFFVPTSCALLIFFWNDVVQSCGAHARSRKDHSWLRKPNTPFFDRN